MAIPFVYNVRSVRQRWTSGIVAVLGIAGAVGVFVAMLSMARGFRATLVASGSPANAIVLPITGWLSAHLGRFPDLCRDLLDPCPAGLEVLPLLAELLDLCGNHVRYRVGHELRGRRRQVVVKDPGVHFQGAERPLAVGLVD